MATFSNVTSDTPLRLPGGPHGATPGGRIFIQAPKGVLACRSGGIHDYSLQLPPSSLQPGSKIIFQQAEGLHHGQELLVSSPLTPLYILVMVWDMLIVFVN